MLNKAVLFETIRFPQTKFQLQTGKQPCTRPGAPCVWAHDHIRSQFRRIRPTTAETLLGFRS